MIKIRVLCVGKIKEKFYVSAIDEYSKRLGRYCDYKIIQVDDEPAPEKLSDADRENVLLKEAGRLFSKIPDSAYVCTLEIAGRKLSSEGFSKWLDELATGGRSEIYFVIGGSLGLHSSVSKHADYKLSFSDMTFPHQLMRVILSEQLYRAFRISRGEPYHK